METRVAVLAVIVREADSVAALNALLHQYESAVLGRMGIPCRERGIRKNELAVRSGVTPSTVYSMMDPRRRDVSIVTIKILCDGLDISLEQFFSGPEFAGLEQEIK